jgi:hypothetical protein
VIKTENPEQNRKSSKQQDDLPDLCDTSGFSEIVQIESISKKNEDGHIF